MKMHGSACMIQLSLGLFIKFRTLSPNTPKSIHIFFYGIPEPIRLNGASPRSYIQNAHRQTLRSKATANFFFLRNIRNVSIISTDSWFFAVFALPAPFPCPPSSTLGSLSSIQHIIFTSISRQIKGKRNLQKYVVFRSIASKYYNGLGCTIGIRSTWRTCMSIITVSFRSTLGEKIKSTLRLIWNKWSDLHTATMTILLGCVIETLLNVLRMVKKENSSKTCNISHSLTAAQVIQLSWSFEFCTQR